MIDSQHAAMAHSGPDALFSALGLGCSRIGSFNNPQPLGKSLALLEAAVEMGVTVIDTSNIYGQGDSERVIGRALRGKRESAFIVTKAGQGFSAKMRALRMLKPVLRSLLVCRSAGERAVTAHRETEMRTDWRPGHIVASLDASLRRLGTDHVDGFLLHSPPAEAVRQGDAGAALLALRQAGKVRHFGVSCDDQASLDAALAMPGLSLLQLPAGLLFDAANNGVAERIRQLGIRVMAREVLRMQPGISPAEAVRRALDQPFAICALIGTTNRAHLAAHVGALRR
jgi:aryl-alcohol dehydrogenase-like predicted oxidoreductase